MKRIISFVLALSMCLTLFCCVTFQSAAADTLWGIDVSKWQGSINWTSVKNAGVDFAILRGWCYGKDTYFDANYSGAKAAGVPIGVYCFTYGDTVAEITAEMNNLISVLDGKQFEYPIYVDMEDADTYGSYSKSYNASLAIAALEVLEEAGYYAGIYTYTSFIASYLDMTNIANVYTTWIADYRTTCGYTGPYDMWQYSCEGSVSGISGNVDMNWCYKSDFEETIKRLGLNNFEPTVTYTYPYAIDDSNLMIYDGENIGPVTTAFNTTAALDTGKTDKALKMTYTSPAAQASGNKIGGMAYVALTDSADLSSYDTITFDLYLSQTMTGSNGFQMNFCTSSGDGYNAMKALDNFEAGWHTITLEKAKIGKAVDTADWANINSLRLTWFNYAGTSTENYFMIDNIKASKPAEPTVTYPYVVDDSTLMIYDGEDAVPFTNNFGASTSLVTGKTGNALKLDCPTPTKYATQQIGGMTHLALTNAADLSGYDTFTLDLYLSRAFEGSAGFQVNFCTSGSDGYNTMKALKGLSAGWNTIVLDRAGIAMAKEADWTNITSIRLTFFNYEQNETATYFLIDNFKAVKESETPVVVYPYVVDNDTLMVYDGEDKSSVKTAYNTVASIESGKTNNALKMLYTSPTGDTTGNVGGMVYFTLTNATDFTAYDTFTFDLYLEKAFETSAGFQVNFCTSGSDGYNAVKGLKGLSAGWNTITFNRADIPMSKDADWSNITVLRMTFFNYEKAEGETYFMIDNFKATKGSTVIDPGPSETPSETPSEDEPTEDFPWGDVDENGSVNAADALLVLKYAVGKETFTERQQIIANVDGSDAIDAGDALDILKYAVGKISVFNVELM